MTPSSQAQVFAKHLPTAMIMLDSHTNVLWWNTAAQKLLHPTQGQALETLLPSINPTALLTEHTPVEIVLKQRPKVYLSISSISYPRKETLLLVEDITHIHHLEKMRQDFVANVSHELRTPLTVICGYLEKLTEEETQSDRQEIFKQMQQQSQRMERLVEDLLLLSRLEIDAPSENQLKKIAVSKMLEQIVHDAKCLSGKQKHHFSLTADRSLKILGLESELRSTFSNLIFNAVHYTPAHGKISIRWYQKASHAYLDIEDTGIGISQEHIHRITERFYRVDHARSRESGGTGLGLAIVKHALIRHHAKLDIKSTPHHGSCFTCIFPLT